MCRQYAYRKGGNMKSYNKVPDHIKPVSRSQAIHVADEVALLLQQNNLEVDYWFNSTSVKGVRHVRVRIQNPSSQAQVDAVGAEITNLLQQKVSDAFSVYSNSLGYSTHGNSYTPSAILHAEGKYFSNTNFKIWYVSEPGKHIPEYLG